MSGAAVAFEKAIVIAASMATGWSTSHSGPSADCLYLIFTSRRPSIQPTGRVAQMSRRRTLRGTGTVTRRVSSIGVTAAPASA